MIAETSEARGDRELVEWVGKRPERPAVRDVRRNHARYRHAGGTAEAEADLRRLVAAGRLVQFDQPPNRQGGPGTVVFDLLDTCDTTPAANPSQMGENGDGDTGDGDTTSASQRANGGCVTVTDVTDPENSRGEGRVTGSDSTTYEGEIWRPRSLP